METNEHRYNSIGILRYSHTPGYGWKLIAEVDKELVRFSRALVPKTIHLNSTRYAPHISIIRKEVPPNLDLWGLHEGKEISFEYNPYIFNGEVYYWLRVFSVQIEKIRLELGLLRYSSWSRPPDGQDCFHITIGNCKNL
jgi:hypothetical protein